MLCLLLVDNKANSHKEKLTERENDKEHEVLSGKLTERENDKEHEVLSEKLTERENDKEHEVLSVSIPHLVST